MSHAMEKAVQGLIYAMSGIVDIVLLGVEIATDSVLSILTLGSLNNQNTGLTGKYNEGNYELQKFRNGNQYQENLNKLGTRTGEEMHENDAIVDFMITSGLVVASFIPGAAAVTVPALIAYKAMRGAYEGGAGGAAAGAVAGAINTVTQKGGVSVNLGYSYANGYSAGVSVGFGPNGTGPQVGLDWSDKNGFGASVGYGFSNGVGLDVGVSQRGGTTYSASLSGKGVPVSLNYSLNVNGGKQTNTFGVSIQLPGTEHFSNVRGSLNYSDRLGLSSGVSYNIGKGESPKPMTEAERAQYNLLDDLIGGLGSVVSGIGRGVKSVWDGVFGGERQFPLQQGDTRPTGLLDDTWIDKKVRSIFGFKYEDLSNKSGYQYEKDESGKIIGATDKYGNKLSYQYGESGKIESVKIGDKTLTDGGIVKIGSDGKISVVNRNEVGENSFVYVNGRDTNPDYAIRQAQGIQSDSGRDVYLVYNSPSGHMATAATWMNSGTDESQNTLRFLIMNGKIDTIFGHSEGGAIAGSALKSVLGTPQGQPMLKNINYVTFGGAQSLFNIPDNLKSATFYLNKGDFIFSNPVEFSSKYNSNYKLITGSGWGHNLENYIYDANRYMSDHSPY